MAKELDYMDPDALVIIGLDTEDDETHPLWDARINLPIDESLVRNILVYGIQMPVLIRQEAGKAYVIDGRQRVRAAREAASRQSAAGEAPVRVPVRKVQGEDGRVVGIMVSANELRQGDDILVRAQKAARLMDLRGDIDEVAIAFGRTVTAIRNWFSLLEADPVVHTAVREGRVSASAAIELSRMPREMQGEGLEKLLRQHTDGGKVSASEVQELRISVGDTQISTTRAAPAHHSVRKQTGIKRSWLRKALSTEAAAKLAPKQRAVLEWFASGEASKGDWFDDFRWEAETELESKPKGRAKKPVEPAEEV
jgi:ParB family chromosome partitioning protein